MIIYFILDEFSIYTESYPALFHMACAGDCNNMPLLGVHPSLSRHMYSLYVLSLLTINVEGIQAVCHTSQKGQCRVCHVADVHCQTLVTRDRSLWLQRRPRPCQAELRQLTAAGQSRRQVGRLQD